MALLGGGGSSDGRGSAVRTRCGAQRVSGRERVRRQVVARDQLLSVTTVTAVTTVLLLLLLLLLVLLLRERIVARRLGAPIVWLALAERRVVVCNAEAKSSGQTLLRTNKGFKRLEIGLQIGRQFLDRGFPVDCLTSRQYGPSSETFRIFPPILPHPDDSKFERDAQTIN